MVSRVGTGTTTIGLIVLLFIGCSDDEPAADFGQALNDAAALDPDAASSGGSATGGQAPADGQAPSTADAAGGNAPTDDPEHDDLDAGLATDGAVPADAAVIRDGSVPTDATLLMDATNHEGAPADGATQCTADDVPLPNDGISEAVGTGGCPAGMALVDTFCIDRYEAALIRIIDAGEQSWSPFFNPGVTSVRAISAVNAIPQAYISQVQASTACIAAGKRLCSNTEWLRACRGPSTFTYPYGNSRQPGVCNDVRSVDPLVEFFGTTDAAIYSHIDHPCLNQLSDTVDPTGSQNSCISAEGIYDLMGNLNEWTSDATGTLRGGSYVDTAINGEGCLNAITAHNTSHFDYTTGFRCCADP